MAPTAIDGSSRVTKLFWDPNYGLPQLALERTSSDALLRRYVYGLHLSVGGNLVGQGLPGGCDRPRTQNK